MLLEGLEASSSRQDQPWDQFEANHRKFGVKTSFNEDQYTTKLDKSKAKISVAEAARIAAEIESAKTSNVHLAEERGHRLEAEVRDAGCCFAGAATQVLEIEGEMQAEDEEERYSAVQRGGKASNGAAPGKAMENGGPPTRPAWSNAGASVAAVSGRYALIIYEIFSKCSKCEPLICAFLDHRPANVKIGTPSAPIEVSQVARREHNKVRMQLVGEKGKDRSSPYGTPMGQRSPLASPLVGNASQVYFCTALPAFPKWYVSIQKIHASRWRRWTSIRAQLDLTRSCVGSLLNSRSGSPGLQTRMPLWPKIWCR